MKPPMHKTTKPTKSRESPKKTPPKAPVPGGGHMSADEMKFRAQDALHTLKRAHEIQQDPHLMAHVKVHAQREREALKKIARKAVG